MPSLLRHFGVAPAPWSRFLAGQRRVLMDQLGITFVIDAGANTGQYGGELRRAGFTGHIASFEPGSEAVEELQNASNADPRWAVHALGLAETVGLRELHCWTGSATSVASLHVPSSGMVAMLGKPATETVELTTVDEWMVSSGFDATRTLLKIDVQGAEAEVLRGATVTLRSLPMVELELPLRIAYEGQASFVELIELLEGSGFTPCSVMTERFHSGWRGAVDVDALFIRKEFALGPGCEASQHTRGSGALRPQATPELARSDNTAAALG